MRDYVILIIIWMLNMLFLFKDVEIEDREVECFF